MPYTKESASAAGKKGMLNRWKNKSPDDIRNKQIKLTVSAKESELFVDNAKRRGMNKTEYFVYLISGDNFK